jgi:hypothetical protein
VENWLRLILFHTEVYSGTAQDRTRRKFYDLNDTRARRPYPVMEATVTSVYWPLAFLLTHWDAVFDIQRWLVRVPGEIARRFAH